MFINIAVRVVGRSIPFSRIGQCQVIVRPIRFSCPTLALSLKIMIVRARRGRGSRTNCQDNGCSADRRIDKRCLLVPFSHSLTVSLCYQVLPCGTYRHNARNPMYLLWAAPERNRRRRLARSVGKSLRMSGYYHPTIPDIGKAKTYDLHTMMWLLLSQPSES